MNRVWFRSARCPPQGRLQHARLSPYSLASIIVVRAAREIACQTHGTTLEIFLSHPTLVRSRSH